MECFAHAGAPAIGTCKSCGKGICRECARDLGFAVACSERCSTRAVEQESFNEKVKKIYAAGVMKNAVGVMKKMPTIVLIMFVLFGTLFLAFGLYDSINSAHVDIFALGMGSAFLLLSVIVYKQVRTIYRNT